MRVGFIIPVLDEYDVDTAYNNIEAACIASDYDFDVVFALNSKLNVVFTKIRNTFSAKKNVRALKVEQDCNQQKLITIAMLSMEQYDAVIIYSGKEEINADVVKAFLASHQAGNKIVYLKKVYRGFAKFTSFLKQSFYKLGIKMLGIYKDVCAETDIQLLDQEVVKTVNKLPGKNQQLRTLDGFVYFSTDIIHLEVDHKEFVNPIYQDKLPGHKRNAVLAAAMFAISLGFVATSIILLALSVNIHFLFHLGFALGFVLFAFFGVVINTKRRLNLRVGKEIPEAELRSIKNQCEYYNLTLKI